MPDIDRVDNEDGTATIIFQESVPMSSYLACFIVSDFASQNDLVNENLTMRVFATPAQLSKVNFALKTGLSITRYYIDYFGVDYPLPKLGKIYFHQIRNEIILKLFLDMVAIPDFVR